MIFSSGWRRRSSRISVGPSMPGITTSEMTRSIGSLHAVDEVERLGPGRRLEDRVAARRRAPARRRRAPPPRPRPAGCCALPVRSDGAAGRFGLLRLLLRLRPRGAAGGCGRSCPRPAFEVDVDEAAGLLDDAVDGGEAEAGPLARRSLVVKNGSKIFSFTSGVMPVPVSATSSSTYSPGLKPCSRNFWLSAVGHVGGADRELAAVRHGVARIDGEVHDHLLELVQVRLDRPDVAAVTDLELDRLAEQPGEQHGDVGERLVELDHLRPKRLPPRERQELPHQAGGAVGVLLDVHDVLEGRIGRPVVGEEQVGEADDGGQHVVEVVRDAAGELADRLHLLALRELQLERPLLGRLQRVDDGRVLARRRLPGSG